jgi:hypothetical protein
MTTFYYMDNSYIYIVASTPNGQSHVMYMLYIVTIVTMTMMLWKI